MSSEAIGYVYRHSPYKGATFSVHLAMADSVNDQFSNEFWMQQGRLAAKARIGRPAANEAVGKLVADGFVVDLGELPGKRGVRRYRFLFPDRPVVYDSRRVASDDTSADRPVASDDTTCRPGQQVPVASDDTDPKGEPKENPTHSSPATPEVDEHADDVERLCVLLADLIEANGSKRPTITKRWRDECSRMIRIDKRPPLAIENAIRWSQAHSFWRANIMSMPKLRDRFDTLRLQAQQERMKSRPQAPAVPQSVDALTDYIERRGLAP